MKSDGYNLEPRGSQDTDPFEHNDTDGAVESVGKVFEVKLLKSHLGYREKIRLSVSHNGRYWSTISFNNLDEIQSTIDALQNYLGKNL